MRELKIALKWQPFGEGLFFNSSKRPPTTLQREDTGGGF